MKRRYLRYFSWYRATAIYRDLGDTGIVTCGIAILTEVSRVSHNTNLNTVFDALALSIMPFTDGVVVCQLNQSVKSTVYLNALLNTVFVVNYTLLRQLQTMPTQNCFAIWLKPISAFILCYPCSILYTLGLPET